MGPKTRHEASMLNLAPWLEREYNKARLKIPDEISYDPSNLRGGVASFTVEGLTHCLEVAVYLLAIYESRSHEVDTSVISNLISTSTQVAGKLGNLQRLFANFEKEVEATTIFLDMIRLATNIKKKPKGKSYVPQEHGMRIDVENITFQHGENFILRNLSFTIKSGELLAIVGKNG